MSKIEKQYFECMCHSDEHTLRFSYDPDENEMFTSVFLNEYGFIRRIWNALKYIFGYKSQYGHFNCWMLNPDDADRLITLLSKIKNGKNKNEN